MPKRILITAGTTCEMIDPVRLISNVATGVLGYELAQASKRMKHKTTLISGPTTLKVPAGVRCLRVVSSEDMRKAVRREFPRHDLLFMTAAVCDFKPKKIFKRKIKRKGMLVLRLRETPDILRSLVRRRRDQTVVGFCLETENLLANARRKMRNKRLDYIVACLLRKGRSPFGPNQLGASLLGRNAEAVWFKPQRKSELARNLLRWVLSKPQGSSPQKAGPL